MKDIIGYENLYKVTKDGNIFSVRSNKFLKLNYKKNGYVYIELNKNGEAKTFRVHRLVALAFINNSEDKKYVNHINGIKSDNRVENLEWCTPSENNIHSFKNGLQKPRVNIIHIYKKEKLIAIACGNLEAMKFIGVKSDTTLNKYMNNGKEVNGYTVKLIERSTTSRKTYTISY